MTNKTMNKKELKLIEGWERNFVEDYWTYSSLEPVRILLQQQAVFTREETIKECIGIAKNRYSGSNIVPQIANLTKKQ
jgi:hypothetical protein